jgi:hypothetical protein
MYRFPLQVITLAGDKFNAKGDAIGGTPAVIGDARGCARLTLSLGGTAQDDNARAAFVCNALNDPARYFLRHVVAQAAIAKAAGRDKDAEFWHRLSGSVRKACDMG